MTLVTLVPKAGLEPARISPHAPQTCASTNSATWAFKDRSASLDFVRDDASRHFFAGALLAAPLITDDRGRACMTASVSDVRTKATKNPVVSLCRSVVAPRAPNAVCDPPPPNAPARSAPFPCCTSTTRMRKMLMTTWMTTSNTVIDFSRDSPSALLQTRQGCEFFPETPQPSSRGKPAVDRQKLLRIEARAADQKPVDRSVPDEIADVLRRHA